MVAEKALLVEGTDFAEWGASVYNGAANTWQKPQRELREQQVENTATLKSRRHPKMSHYGVCLWEQEFVTFTVHIWDSLYTCTIWRSVFGWEKLLGLGNGAGALSRAPGQESLE